MLAFVLGLRKDLVSDFLNSFFLDNSNAFLTQRHSIRHPSRLLLLLSFDLLLTQVLFAAA